MEINEEKLNALLGQALTEMGAAANGPLIKLGDSLGLYKSLSTSGPMTSIELATATSTAERYIREWLSAQAASGIVNYDPETKKFYMTPEQTAIYADSSSPIFLTGAYYAITSLYDDEPKIRKAFQTGEGVSWGDHNNCLFCGTEKFFSPSYENSLVAEWLPSLEGVIPKLKQGAKVADIGCGHAASTLVMAREFPNSQFVGFDFHEPSISYARSKAKELNLSNVSFEVSLADSFSGHDYDLITYFDCLHDMGDPEGACKHALNSLKEDGSCLIVEPFAKDSLEDNLNPISRAFYAFSTMICTPCSLHQDVGLALGAQAGEKKLREVVISSGFTRFRKAFETPFNLILEARP